MQHKSLTASKSGLTISERRKSLNKILNRQRSTIMIARKINLSKISNHVRLVGGADVSEESNAEEILSKASPLPASIQEVPHPSPSFVKESVDSSPVEESVDSSPVEESVDSSPVEKSVDSSPVEESARSETDTDKKSQEDNKQPLSASGPCCFCVPQLPRSVGDRKVDEIIEYVHQNLEEAGKALSTLGENFEHDLKLIFVDILGRIKQWSGIVQNKLEGCKNEIDNLRKELLARACEMNVKMREMEDLKAQITDYQNASLLNDELKKNHKAVRPEQKEEKIRDTKDEFIAENVKRIKYAAINKDQIKIDQVEEEDEETVKEARINDQNQVTDRQKIERDAKRINETKIKDTITVRVVDQIDEEDKVNEKRARAIDKEDEEDKVNEKRARAIDKEDEEEFLIKKEHKESDQKEATYVTIAAQTTVQEKTKRESELESEVAQLRKKYNRVIKDRTEYENAIQRALLRGVSSLNVEALRVLRCPPIPCCTPCAPCPAGIIPPEPVMSCPAKSVRRRPESTAATNKSSAKVRDRNGNQVDCTTKRPCASPCCIAGRTRKSENSSMVFLLRQGNTGNLHDEETATPVCGSIIMRKIELPPLRRLET